MIPAMPNPNIGSIKEQKGEIAMSMEWRATPITIAAVSAIRTSGKRRDAEIKHSRIFMTLPLHPARCDFYIIDKVLELEQAGEALDAARALGAGAVDLFERLQRGDDEAGLAYPVAVLLIRAPFPLRKLNQLPPHGAPPFQRAGLYPAPLRLRSGVGRTFCRLRRRRTSALLYRERASPARHL